VKVCAVGLGQIGLPTATYILGRGFETWGYDISEASTNEAKAKGIKATTDWKQIPHEKIGAYVVCVTTGLDSSSKPDLSPVFEVCSKIAATNNMPLIAIESTLQVGTCRNIYDDIFGKSAHLVHVPHRYWRDDPIKHGVRQVRVLGGIDNNSIDRGMSFYRRLSIPTHPVSSIEIAEMSKIVENSHRFLQIAFAEELKMVCDQKNIDMNELRQACNTKWNVEILEPKEGILRHCLPKDVRYLIDYSKSNRILKSAVLADEKYREYLDKKLLKCDPKLSKKQSPRVDKHRYQPGS